MTSGSELLMCVHLLMLTLKLAKYFLHPQLKIKQDKWCVPIKQTAYMNCNTNENVISVIQSADTVLTEFSTATKLCAVHATNIGSTADALMEYLFRRK